MTLLSNIKNNLLVLVTLILLVIIVLQRCSSTGGSTDEVKIIRDTLWVSNDTTIISKPQIIQTIPVDVSRDTIINQYIPDTNYAKLVIQYQELVNELLAKNIMQDSIRIDTNGYVKITDTVQKNVIVGRSSQVSIKYPIIKETIIQPPLKTRQVYVGGQLSGNPEELINGINGGLLMKNKKDQIYGVTVGLNTQGNISYGLQSYWKIKLKK